MLLDISLIVLFISLPLSATSVCYYADGTEAKNFQPCDPDAEFTHCCRASDVCVSNGLCFSTGLGSLVKRGCTDKTWNNNTCPNVCPDYGIQEPLLTYCGEYGRFCCGSDKAARECCDSTNSTLRVNVTSGDPIYWKQSDGQNKSLKTTRNVLIALTAGFGTAFLVAGWFAYRGRQGLKHQDQSWSELERERQRKLAAQQNLEKLESALKQVIIPPDVRREIENARGPQVPVDSMELEQDEFIAGRPRN